MVVVVMMVKRAQISRRPVVVVIFELYSSRKTRKRERAVTKMMVKLQTEKITIMTTDHKRTQ